MSIGFFTHEVDHLTNIWPGNNYSCYVFNTSFYISLHLYITCTHKYHLLSTLYIVFFVFIILVLFFLLSVSCLVTFLLFESHQNKLSVCVNIPGIKSFTEHHFFPQSNFPNKTAQMFFVCNTFKILPTYDFLSFFFFFLNKKYTLIILTAKLSAHIYFVNTYAPVVKEIWTTSWSDAC